MSGSIYRKKRFWIGIVVAFVCLGLVLRTVKLEELSTALAHADYRWLVAALPIYLLGYVVRGFRWHYLLSPVKSIPTVRLLPYLIIGFMANNVLPLRLGEFVRPYLAGRREGVSRTASFATVVLERVFDGLTMLAILGVSSAFLTGRLDHVDPHFTVFGWSGADVYRFIRISVYASAAVFLGLLAGGFAVITFRDRSMAWISQLARLLPGPLPEKVEGLLHRFVGGLAVLKSRTVMMYAFGLSVLAWGLEGMTYFLVAQAFGLPPSLPSIFMLMALVNLAIMVPSSPGGWGPFEMVGLWFLHALSIPEGTGLAYLLVVHGIIIFPITAWGLWYMSRLHLTFREIEETGEKEAESNPV